MSAGTIGLDITVPRLKSQAHAGFVFVFVSVGATAPLVTVKTKEISDNRGCL